MHHRARVAILSHICSHSLQQEIQGRPYPPPRGSRFDLEAKPVVGDLVSLSGMIGPSSFYLAWVEEVGEAGQTHLLRSVDDGDVAEWANIGFTVFDREQVAANPHWRWTDEQYEFNDRWAAVSRQAGLGGRFKRRAVLFEGEGCTLRGECRGGGEGFSRSVPSWRELGAVSMIEIAREIADGSLPTG